MHDREQILTGKSLPHPLRIRSNYHRIAAVDEHPHHRLLFQLQRFTDPVHIDRACPAVRAQIRTGQRPVIRGAVAAVPLERSAAGLQPGTGKCRKTSDRAHVHAAVIVMLQAVADVDMRDIGFAVQLGQLLDILRRNACDLRDPPGRVGEHMLAQLLMARCITLEKSLVCHSVPEQDMHQPERKRRIRAGVQG
ncbi:hypothetical protein D3C76_253200 [compost metagenome]